MELKDKVEAWVKAGQLNVDGAGKITGRKIIMIHEGRDAVSQHDTPIEQQTDADGDAAARLVLRKQAKMWETWGWKSVTTVSAPKGAEKKPQRTRTKKS